MTIQADLPRLYVSLPHSCPYLAGKVTTTVMLDPEYRTDNTVFSLLVKSGFRRSGKTIYKPQCKTCDACISVRIPADAYKPNRAQRRCYAKNSDIRVSMIPPAFNEEHFLLYRQYQSRRHKGDIMDQDDPKWYRQFMVDSSTETILLEFRLGERLVSVSVCDLTDDGMSAVYTYYDPNLSERSLGTLAVMKQLEYVREMGLEWLYIGYWIEGCRKMDYKISFRPIFGFMNGEWRLLRL